MTPLIGRVGQNRICPPYMAIYLVISLPKDRIYTVYIWFWPTLYARRIFDILSWEFTIYTAIYGAYIHGSGQPYCSGHASFIYM